ncbi:MAG: phage head closure protein [Candidatus Binatia bacterium]|nr:phage head closure protein [Candidatus Binatia bacterium]
MSVFTSLLIDSFVISRESQADDTQGGWTVSWVDVVTIDGRLRPASASEREVAQQEQSKLSHVLYCEVDVDIVRGNLVTGAGKTVKVIAVREPSHMGHHLEVDCEEIQVATEEIES